MVRVAHDRGRPGEALASLVMVAVLAGCAGTARVNSSRPTASAVKPTTSQAPGDSVKPSVATVPATLKPIVHLAADVLAPQDLPPGWSLFIGPKGASTSTTRGCLSALTTSNGQLDRAEVRYQGGTGGTDFVDQVLESFGSDGAVTELARYRQVLTACGRLTVVSSGATFTGTMVPVSFPPLGDDSSAYQVTLTSVVGATSVSLGYGIVVARRSDIVMVLVVTSLDPAGVNQLQQRLARTATAKLK